ncbi:MAG: 50S ribosomal protein L18 [Candidatus Bathyarchaeota archaeon]|nr:50S ribosomal protein L18 [Candidatus Bathyarchaeota archaeon]
MTLAEDNRKVARIKRHKRIRKTLSGNSVRPRLCVFRSLKNIYVQAIDDKKGTTLVSASTLNPEIKEKIKYHGNVKAAELLGTLLVKKLKEKGITKVVFDRGGYLYHGRVKTLAENIRKEKIIF